MRYPEVEKKLVDCYLFRRTVSLRLWDYVEGEPEKLTHSHTVIYDNTAMEFYIVVNEIVFKVVVYQIIHVLLSV